MDQKTWLWRRKPSEKTILAISEEAQSVSSEREADLENSLKILNEKLSSAVDECSSKDELLHNYKREAEVAAAGKHKAEEDVRRLTKELEEAQQQKSAANERLGHLNSTLKDCMSQLSLVRQEQDRRMHEAVMKTSQEFEKSHTKLEEKLSETSKRLASLTSENAYLTKALFVKEKLLEDLNSAKIETEAEFETLMARLDSVEKENAFLRYEFRSLEKEVEIKNEELECSRRSLEGSNKSYLENVKKIKKLEGECQRLRSLTRKVQGRNPVGARRNGSICNDEYCSEKMSKKVGFLIDQVQDLQRENEIFKEFLAKKDEEILNLQRLKNLEAKGRVEQDQSAPDEVSSDETNSRALALVSGHDHDELFKESKMKTESQMIGASSEMRLMDDFVEMEKLAIVAVDSPEIKKSTDDWLQTVTSLILEQHEASSRSIDELLEDVRTSSSCRIRHPHSLPVSGYITWKSPPSSPSPNPTSVQESSSEMNQSIMKLIELISTFGLSSSEERGTEDSYEVRVFRWRRRDPTTVLQEFIDTCNELLDGKASFEKFTRDSTHSLEMIINTCVSFQENYNVREEFRKHLGGEGPGTALELESVQNLMLEMEKMHSVSQVEIKGLKDKLSFTRSSSLVSDSSQLQNEALLHKLAQSRQGIASLESEMEKLKEAKRLSEDELENVKAMNEELDTQFNVTKAELNRLTQKLSSAEIELDGKSQCCDELEGTCLELQLQLQSIASSHQDSENQENQAGLLQTGMEISKASAKLAECEETMMKLGKQLKALGSANELSAKTKHNLKQRSSLLDQMMSEDNGEESPKTKEVICSYKSTSFPDETPATNHMIKNETRNLKSGALAIIPSKKRGGGAGFLRKLLLRRKKASSKSKNTTVYFGK